MHSIDHIDVTPCPEDELYDGDTMRWKGTQDTDLLRLKDVRFDMTAKLIEEVSSCFPRKHFEASSILLDKEFRKKHKVFQDIP